MQFEDMVLVDDDFADVEHSETYQGRPDPASFQSTDLRPGPVRRRLNKLTVTKAFPRP